VKAITHILEELVVAYMIALKEKLELVDIKMLLLTILKPYLMQLINNQ
jgi:hypothetical protein